MYVLFQFPSDTNLFLCVQSLPKGVQYLITEPGILEVPIEYATDSDIKEILAEYGGYEIQGEPDI